MSTKHRSFNAMYPGFARSLRRTPKNIECGGYGRLSGRAFYPAAGYGPDHTPWKHRAHLSPPSLITQVRKGTQGPCRWTRVIRTHHAHKNLHGQKHFYRAHLVLITMSTLSGSQSRFGDKLLRGTIVNRIKCCYNGGPQ